jgi:hypothetical protein
MPTKSPTSAFKPGGHDSSHRARRKCAGPVERHRPTPLRSGALRVETKLTAMCSAYGQALPSELKELAWRPKGRKS